MPSNGYSDAELAEMMRDPESDLVERKRSLSDSAAEKARRSICAFANDLPGSGRPAVIIIGAEDNGRCSGLMIDDDLLKRLADMRDDARMLPPPSMDVSRRTLDSCTVAVVIVQPAQHPPVRYGGRVWVRVGPTVRQASASDERRLAERRRATDLPFDLRPAYGAVVTDLDLGYIERQYLPRAVAADVLAENEQPLVEQMRSLRLVIGDVPTNGAMLAFGRDPRRWVPESWVQFVRFDGDEATDPIKNSQVLAGRLDDILDSLSQLVKLNVGARLEIDSSPHERRFHNYPVEALRQLAYNAIMHRSYDGDARPVASVLVLGARRDRESGRALRRGDSAGSLLHGVTAYRNQLVAEIMANLGFAQRFGYGIPLALRTLRNNGNPKPEFQTEHSRFRVVVKAAR